MKSFQRTLVTTALPYANGPVHIGHLAGVYVPADIYVRYLRLKGENVLFVGGSDEHGVPVTIRARKEGITTQEVVDRYHNIIKESFEGFGISFDVYSRTTSKIHHQLASDFFRKLYDDGKFVEQISEQFYDPETQEFLTDRNIRGECPRCHASGAYGDQCEKCGATLSPDELINPYNAINGNPLTKKETKHWYLPLDQYQPWLEEWILQEHKEWRPNVYGQCKSWLDGGLRPRAVTRDLDWGIPVPVEGAEGKVLYVWFDAPIGYISNTKELCDAKPEQFGNWETWWKDSSTRLIHSLAKTILCSTALSSLPCSKQRAVISYLTTYLQTSSLTSKAIKSLPLAIGRYGSTNTSWISLINRTFCAMYSRQMHQRLRTTTSLGRTFKHATITSS